MFQPTTVSDLLDSLRDVQRTASSVEAWTDNDGEPSLNSFANSGVGGKRSDALLDVIEQAKRMAGEALEFTQHGNGRLLQRQRAEIEGAGFDLIAGEPYYTAVSIPPTEEACLAAEAAGEPIPDSMELVLLSQPEDED